MKWDADKLNELARSFQPACVLFAAAEMNLFSRLRGRVFSASEAAGRLACDPRAVTILLDALAALAFLEKNADRYAIPIEIEKLLCSDRPGNQLAMVQHLSNCSRRWGKLAETVTSGKPPPREASIRGHEADYSSFIEAMDNVSGPVADSLIAELGQLPFTHLLDVGGGSGTWTLAFMRAYPGARATIFDLPQVKLQALARIESAELSGRIAFTPGDFYSGKLPSGADLAWVSAIVHQNSRAQNRELFGRVHEALAPQGQILIRDILMEPSRTEPVAGALFAVNMLTGTEQGGTFTFEELAEDLLASGFKDPLILRRDEGMHSVIKAQVK